MRTHYSSVLIAAFFLSLTSASAQDIREAYYLSNLTVQGTARSMGFGNALGSVGGDFSSISVNPAGLGIYRSSEFTFTPSLRVNGSSSDYAGTTTADNNTHFNINNWGMVFTHAPKGKRYERANWKAVSFAIGMNRVADFNRNYTYQGRNTTSSASRAFESDANQYPGDVTATPPYNGLGYIGFQSYLLNQNASNQFVSIVPFSKGINQLKSIQENGGLDEYTISLGGNYREKLMLGITIGVPVFNYQRSSSYQETLAAGNPGDANGFSSFNYTNALNISGSGINAKIGAIYKITDFIRVGAAIHTPTYYTITDVSDPGMTSVVNSTVTYLSVGNGALAENRFDYSFTSPLKAVLSATFLLNKIGFITADYEYVDYNSMHYSYTADYALEQSQINQAIRQYYQGASNFRLGAEGRLGKFFMLRAGAGYYGNPYKNTDVNGQRIDVSGGLGFHFKHFFTDLALVHSMYKSAEQPYSIDYSGGSVVSGSQATVPTATTTYSINNIAMTVGMKF